ncbi:MAG: thioredoxin domain-containing protein [Candidatus Methylomirabilia bacterium]
MAASNRLAREKSPYLLAHAGNPVDWYPWGPEAFAAARARDVPLFVSIGYSACHWCHVMERESFEDAGIARLMNENLVAVKVDREELPAVDHLFMAFCQGLTGGGGWPLTVALTPAGKPFFAGTYFPKESGFGRAGMTDLAPSLGRLWREEREKVLRTADELERALAAQVRPAAAPFPGPEVIDGTKDELASLYDARWGGFGTAPKFPTAPWLFFLMRYAEKHGGDGRARIMVEETLRAMRLGGIFDHLGYGFHRYSTDAGWLVPHFEKMLYDQALLALAYTEAFRLWGDAAFQTTAAQILAYVLRDLRAPDGGFAAAEDADSEGEEGRFYLWSVDEVTALLEPVAAEEFAAAFHMKANGNFTSEVGERSDRNILHRLSPLALGASDFTLHAGGLPPALETSRTSLLAAREKRVRPRRDDKVLADWNGLMIAALAKAAVVFAAPSYAREAAGAAAFVLTKLRDAEGNLLHRYRDGQAAFPAVVDDYADLAWGCLELHGATGELRWLDEAQSLVEALDARFGDGAGGLFFSAPDPLLPLRQVIATDAAHPAGAAVAAEVFVRLGKATGQARYVERAREIVCALGGAIESAPLGCCQLLSAAMLLEEEPA